MAPSVTREIPDLRASSSWETPLATRDVAGAALQAFARHVPHYLQALEPVIRRIDQ